MSVPSPKELRPSEINEGVDKGALGTLVSNRQSWYIAIVILELRTIQREQTHCNFPLLKGFQMHVSIPSDERVEPACNLTSPTKRVVLGQGRVGGTLLLQAAVLVSLGQRHFLSL